MTMMPVAAREAREASRQPRTYRWRWVTAAAALGLMVFVYWANRRSLSQGHDMFVGLAVASYIYCLLAGAVRTADTIAEEKRDNTLGLLFLTDLKGWDIVFGKLLSSSVNCFFGLLAIFPMLAIPVLMGGVPMGQFGKILLALLNTLFLSLSFGFLISSIFRHSGVTISSALLVMVAVGGGIPLLAVFAREEFHLDGLAEFIFAFSPTQTLVNGFGLPGRRFNHYWTPLIISHVWAWLNLRLAIYFLPRLWQEVPKNKKTERWREKLRAWRFGRGQKKVKFRERLLNQNPLFWLSNRDQVSSGGLLGVIFVVLVGALLLGMAVGNSGTRARVEEMTAIWFVGLAIVHVMIAFRVAMSASYRLAEDRRSGALELLLGTELSIGELLRGHRMALRRQFFGPAVIATLACVFGLALMLLLISEDFRIGNIWETFVEIVTRIFTPGARVEIGWMMVIIPAIQGMLMLNWLGLTWVGMWLGLRENRSGFATWTTLALVLMPPWILFICGVAALGEAGAFNNVSEEVLIPVMIGVGLGLGLVHLGLLVWWARRSLYERFREVAADRYAGPRAFPWRPIGRFVFRFAGVVTILCLVYMGFREVVNRRGEKAWQAALKAHPTFAAKYGKVEMPPQIADAENLAAIPLFDAMTRSGPKQLIMGWNVPRRGSSEELNWNWPQRQRMDLNRIHKRYLDEKVIGTNQTDAVKAILGVLATYEEELKTLRGEAPHRPQVQFKVPITYPRVIVAPGGWSPPGDPRYPVRMLAQTLTVLSCARIAAGEDPLEDILIGLRVADGLIHEPGSIAQYHQTRLYLTQAIYDGIAAGIWNGEQLKKIQERIAAVDFWKQWESFRENYVQRVVDENDPNGRRWRRQRFWLARQMPSGFARERQAELVEWGMKETPKAVDLAARRIDLKKAEELQRSRPDQLRYVNYPDELRQVLMSLGFVQTTADQVNVACAIERFRLEHKKIPSALEELVPKYIARAPTDVFTGKALAYRVKENGHYILYSVGQDGVDDGGRVANVSGSWIFWQATTTGDWVWDSEATEAPAPRSRSKRR